MIAVHRFVGHSVVIIFFCTANYAQAVGFTFSVGYDFFFLFKFQKPFLFFLWWMCLCVLWVACALTKWHQSYDIMDTVYLRKNVCFILPKRGRLWILGRITLPLWHPSNFQYGWWPKSGGRENTSCVFKKSRRSQGWGILQHIHKIM